MVGLGLVRVGVGVRLFYLAPSRNQKRINFLAASGYFEPISSNFARSCDLKKLPLLYVMVDNVSDFISPTLLKWDQMILKVSMQAHYILYCNVHTEHQNLI